MTTKTLLFLLSGLLALGENSSGLVKMKEETSRGNYLFSCFRGSGEDDLYLAYSHDGLSGKVINNDKPLVEPKAGRDKLTRDPCILLGNDGIFHMVWTATVKQRPQPKGKIMLSARSRVEREKGSDQWEETTVAEGLLIGETAIIICDMWDKHWCTGADKRAEELARKMAPVVNKAREKGIQIIHAPSSTMPFYAGWPQRQRMMLAPEVPKPEPLDLPDHPLPIDDSDGGCDTDDESYSAWTRQSPHIEIGEYDGISDDGNEIYNFFKEQGIKGIIMMGVHTNMCVLNRSFAIKQMRRWGIDCLLVRDLTDAMYDPKDAPYVSHDEGTELVVQHIEKYWCPSILSKDLVAALDKL